MISKQTTKREYRIYALYDQERKLVFLGKTYAKSLAPIYSKHLCGKNQYTNEYYGKTAPLVAPHFSVVATVHGTYRDAYRHLVAWTRVFLDSGFAMLMQEGTVAYATALTPATKAIYDTIRVNALESVLEQGMWTSTDLAKIKFDKNVTEKKVSSVQFNLRVFEDDMHDFISFCDDHGLSRKEGFAFLLRNCRNDPKDQDSFAAEEIKQLKERLKSQTEALNDVQNKAQQLSLSLYKESRYQSLLSTVQALLRNYCEVACVNDEPFEKLKIDRYHNFPNVSQYVYPCSEQGTQIVVLRGLVYGKGRTPAIFVLAEQLDGQQVKFRVYAKRSYVGIQIPGSAWMYLGAKWLVTWQRKCDGAIELTGSLPIPASLDTLVPDDYMRYQETNKKLSLDEIIRHADDKRS